MTPVMISFSCHLGIIWEENLMLFYEHVCGGLSPLLIDVEESSA